MKTNANTITLRRDPEFCSLYHVRSGLSIRDLPEGYTVQSEIGRLPEGYWVDTHIVFGPDGERIGYGDSVSDEFHCGTLSELRGLLGYYGLAWVNGELRVGTGSQEN